MMDPEANAEVNTNEPPKRGGGVLAACYRCFFESNSSSAASYLRFSNMLNAILLIIAGVSSLTSLGNWVTLALSFIFLSLYLTCFGCLLCCFELRIGWIERRARNSFGFLYSYVGRSLFLLFVAGLGFGLISQNASLGYAVGILTAINALFNMIIIYRHGKLFADPSAEYGDTAESNAVAYLQANPDLARSAIGAGVSLARDNPEIARQGLQAGAQYAREHPTEAAQVYRSTVY
jgi:hypothetical protein